VTLNDTIAERVMFQVEMDSIIIQNRNSKLIRIWCLSRRL